MTMIIPMFSVRPLVGSSCTWLSSGASRQDITSITSVNDLVLASCEPLTQLSVVSLKFTNFGKAKEAIHTPEISLLTDGDCRSNTHVIGDKPITTEWLISVETMTLVHPLHLIQPRVASQDG